MGKYVKFSDEELERANSMNLYDYLRRRGERLIRSGNDYRWIYRDGSGEHDSITIRDNEWYDHKNQTGGKTIDFLRQNFGFSFREAVQELLGYSAGAVVTRKKGTEQQITIKVTEFKLPEANSNMHRVFAYLTQQRFITPDVLSYFAHEKKLYEDKSHHNAVFVGYDEQGIPRHAHKRSTNSYMDISYRGNVDGSDPKYAFSHIGESNLLYVLEAPIDMLSYITLFPENWKQHSYVSLMGLSGHAMLHALNCNPQLSTILLCVDNDESGIEATDRLTDILQAEGYCTVTSLKSKNKDWNEDLIEQNGGVPKPAVPHNRKILYSKVANELEFQKCSDLSVSASRIWDNYKHFVESQDTESLIQISEHSLSAAGQLICRMQQNKMLIPEEATQYLKIRLHNEYKPYTDKGLLTKKMDAFKLALKEVMADIKDKLVKTHDDMEQTIKKLFHLSDMALRAYVEVIASNEVQEPVYEAEPKTMKLCL
jgi:hypothetical protein